MMWDNNDSWMHGSGFGGWFMFIGLLAIVVAVVFLIVYLIRQTSQPVGAGVHAASGLLTRARSRRRRRSRPATS